MSPLKLLYEETLATSLSLRALLGLAECSTMGEPDSSAVAGTSRASGWR